jgi:enoyl-CoA hydratase/carnithine racemase
MRHHDEKMTSYQKILYQNDQGVARLTLNRPDKRNALDPELIGELQDAIATSAREPDWEQVPARVRRQAASSLTR